MVIVIIKVVLIKVVIIIILTIIDKQDTVWSKLVEMLLASEGDTIKSKNENPR